MNKKSPKKESNIAELEKIAELTKKIKELELDLQIVREVALEEEEILKQRIQIDEYISTNKQQTLFAQLRAVEARLHLAYTIMDLQKNKKFHSEENAIYAQGYLDLIRSKVLI